MLIKGQKIELKITSLAPGGEGVSKDFAIPVFINKTAPGDVLSAEIYDYRKSFAKAKLLKVLSASQERIEPPCKLFKICGGCQWMHLNYQAQLAHKRGIIEQSLRHIAGQTIGETLKQVLLPTIGSTDQLAYRNKVQLPTRNPKDSKRLLAGYFESNSHDLVNIKHCPIQPELLDQILACIKELSEKYQISAYDEKTGKGLLRHIHMRINQTHTSVLITLVLNCSINQLPDYFKPLSTDLINSFIQIKGICINYNEKKAIVF